jgi:hypothetical protein
MPIGTLAPSTEMSTDWLHRRVTSGNEQARELMVLFGVSYGLFKRQSRGGLHCVFFSASEHSARDRIGTIFAHWMP